MSNEIQFLLYNLPDKEGRVQVVIKDETIWCTQKAMAELFGIDKSGISRHIANIFKEEELQQYERLIQQNERLKNHIKNGTFIYYQDFEKNWITTKKPNKE